MGNPRRTHCTCCGKHSSEVGIISWLGNCRACGKAIMNENCEQIAAKSGPAHRRRMRGYARMLERAMLDEQRSTA
jgi:hypothetical protein